MACICRAPRIHRADLRRHLAREGFRLRGGDFDAGARLQPALASRGLVPVHARQVVHSLPAGHPYARLPLAFSRSLAAVWRQHGLVDDAERQDLIRALEAALDAGAASTTFTLVQVAALLPD